MNNFNQAVIEGFLTGDPDSRVVNGGTHLCRFTIGSNRTYTRKDGERVEESDVFDITTWNDTAQACGKFLKKGARVLIGGILRRDRWKTKEGENRYRFYIEGREVEFLSPARDANDGEFRGRSTRG